MEKWEYRSAKFEIKSWFIGGKLDMGKFDVELNILGDDGWEMVSSFDVSQFEGGTKFIVATFRRRKRRLSETD